MAPPLVAADPATEPWPARTSARLLGSAFLVPAGIALLAFVARLYPLLTGGGLNAIITYDDGVYYSASASLVGGRVPYRDFLLLHPPGVMLVLAPFAELGRLTSDSFGMSVARLAVMACGALTAVLVYFVGRRVAPLIGIVGGLFYALWLPTIHSENTTSLEPFVNVGLVLALLWLGQPLTASRRRLVAAGVALGVACTIKVWVLLPILIFAIWVWRTGTLRRAAEFVAATALTIVAICLPFFLIAPHQMVRLVVEDQARRTSNGRDRPGRLANMVGLTTRDYSLNQTWSVIGVIGGLALVALCVLAWKRREARLWIVLLAANAVMLVVISTYYDHYGMFLAVPLALVFGTVVARGITAARAVSVTWGRVAGVLTALALVVIAWEGVTTPAGYAPPSSWLRTQLADATCVTADSSNVLIQSDTLSRSIDNGCDVIADPVGISFDLRSGALAEGKTFDERTHRKEWQRRFNEYLLSGDALVISRMGYDRFTKGSRREIDENPLIGKNRNFYVYDTSGAADSTP